MFRLNLSIALFLITSSFGTFAAWGQVRVGQIDFEKDVYLSSEGAENQRGIQVNIRNIMLEGYRDRLMIFTATVSDAKGEKYIYEFLDQQIDRYMFISDTLSFEFSYQDLQKKFGAGSHTLYFVFDMQTLENEKLISLSGARQVLPLELTLSEEGIVDEFARDKKHNEDIMRRKAAAEPVFADLIKIAQKYNMLFAIREFTVGSNSLYDMYNWEFLTDSDDSFAVPQLQAVAEFWNMLPVDFVRKTKIRGIVFIKELTFLDLGVGAGFDVLDGLLVSQLDSRAHTEAILHGLCHEYMHVMENRFWTEGYFDAGEWHALNPPGTVYQSSGALGMIKDHPEFIHQEHPSPGFLNGYCFADIYQDKAEVFSYLFVPELYKKAEVWMADDPYLKAKFDFMREALRKIDPQFTDEYFDRLHGQKFN